MYESLYHLDFTSDFFYFTNFMNLNIVSIQNYKQMPSVQIHFLI